LRSTMAGVSEEPATSVKPDIDKGEDDAGAGAKRLQGHANGGDGKDAAGPSKRQKPEPKKEEPVPGHRKFLLTGITGIKQEALQGQLDRSGIPYTKLWKARNKDTGEIWLKDDDIFIKVDNLLPTLPFCPMHYAYTKRCR